VAKRQLLKPIPLTAAQKKFPANPTRFLFQISRCRFCSRTNKFKTKRAGQPTHKLLVLIGLVPAQTVIHVQNNQVHCQGAE
jgi:hypothetical protein